MVWLQVAEQDRQLSELRSTFAYNLQLLQARDAELTALDAKLPAQENKIAGLKRTVVNLRTTLARAQAGQRLRMHLDGA